MTRWWLVEQQQIFNIITDWLTYTHTYQGTFRNTYGVNNLFYQAAAGSWQNCGEPGFSMSNHIYLELITRIVLRWKYDQTVLKHNSLREARMKNNKWQNVDGGLVRTFHSSSRRNICSLYLMPISYFAKLSSLIQFSPFPAYHLIELIFSHPRYPRSEDCKL